MGSPNEPGYPRASDGPGGANGSGPGAGHDASVGNAAARPTSSGPQPAHLADSGEAPPWQRGPAARAAARRQPDAPPRRGPTPPAARSAGTRGDHAGAPSDELQSADRQPEDAARSTGSATGHSPGADARLNRFLTGGSAPAQKEEAPTRGERPAAARPETARPETARPETARPETARPETARPEAYASEIPDLSGALPRPAPRKPAVDRPSQEQTSRPAAAGTRVQAGSRHHGPVRASMQIRRIDPWSTLKVSLVLSVAMFFVWMIAVAFLYLVLGGMGVWSKLNSNVGDLLTSASGSTGGELVSSGTIFGGAALIGLVNIVLLTAMATIGAFIYNLTTDIVGGVEVTLADRD